MNNSLNYRVKLEEYFDRLWPIPRSLTGEGNRQTLKILSELIPLTIYEVSSGTVCFDWEIPPEWTPKSAWIKNSRGEKILDFKNNNLHLLGYSTSFYGKLSLSELKKHLYVHPTRRDWIPYVVSYYERRWGFCVSQEVLDSWSDDDIYEVFIDSDLNDSGSLTYGDLVLKGETSEEILLSTYICHPSMANDQISGMLVTAFLYNELVKKETRRYTYRFVFIPETIGAITYLFRNGEYMKKNTKAGFVVTCVGDKGNFTYKHTKEANTLTNRCTLQVLKDSNKPYKEIPFIPQGSDERQYSSPGFNLPVGSLMRTMYWNFEEYHSSADNKEFISFAHLEESIEQYLKVIHVLENNWIYKNQLPFGEVQLGKRNLYPTIGRGNDKSQNVAAYQWLLNFSDGKHDIVAIAERSGLPVALLIDAAKILEQKNLILKIS